MVNLQVTLFQYGDISRSADVVKQCGWYLYQSLKCVVGYWAILVTPGVGMMPKALAIWVVESRLHFSFIGKNIPSDSQCLVMSALCQASHFWSAFPSINLKHCAGFSVWCYMCEIKQFQGRQKRVIYVNWKYTITILGKQMRRLVLNQTDVSDVDCSFLSRTHIPRGLSDSTVCFK